MKTPLLLRYGLLLVCLAFPACAPVSQKDHASAAAMQKQLPVELSYSASNWSSQTIRWENGKLRFIDTYQGRKQVRNFEPTAAGWEEFWKEMDAVDIWHWQPQYSLPPETGVMDGYIWSVKLSHAGRTVESAGNNSYPADSNPRKTGKETAQPTKRFERFLIALKKLSGEKSH